MIRGFCPKLRIALRAVHRSPRGSWSLSWVGQGWGRSPKRFSKTPLPTNTKTIQHPFSCPSQNSGTGAASDGNDRSSFSTPERERRPSRRSRRRRRTFVRHTHHVQNFDPASRRRPTAPAPDSVNGQRPPVPDPVNGPGQRSRPRPTALVRPSYAFLEGLRRQSSISPRIALGAALRFRVKLGVILLERTSYEVVALR